MKNEEFLRLCKAKVAEYTNSHMDKTDGKQITVQDVYVVWSCKTLQNSKALLSTTVPDGMYYELTYNGDKHELSGIQLCGRCENIQRSRGDTDRKIRRTEQ